MEIRAPYFDTEHLRDAIRAEYSRLAQEPACGFHFTVGRPLAARVEYPQALLDSLPETAVAAFAGVGNPFAMGLPRPGETVLDMGSGAGTDALIAARLVGPRGLVIGVDLTPAMIERANANARAAGLANTRFVLGTADALPLPNASVDLVISNGVINLCPDKATVFAEMYRVLRPGGRFQIADTLLDTAVPIYVKDLIHLWTDCVAGGLPKAEYVGLLEEAGFRDVTVQQAYDAFAEAPVEQAARRYGARGYNLRGTR